MKLMDSDHCIAILRGRLNLQGKIDSDEVLAVTTVSIGELTHGAYKSASPVKNLSRLDVLLATVKILQFTTQSAQIFGKLKAMLEKKGQLLSDLDLQIASIALEHGVPLLTHNRKHFDRIPNLIIEDLMI
ncbi:MAG: hypothetical protein B6242_09180 [Anaerolineaceae bacterium 4572_78]|nr:MAG: hypothetical protein B6242_09180 [Anaerolineaceae bacterium 4572_78]